MVILMDRFVPICVSGKSRLIAGCILGIWVIWISALVPSIESISLRLYINYAWMHVSTFLLSLDVFAAQLNLRYSMHIRAYLPRVVSFILYCKNDYYLSIFFLHTWLLPCKIGSVHWSFRHFTIRFWNIWNLRHVFLSRHLRGPSIYKLILRLRLIWPCGCAKCKVIFPQISFGLDLFNLLCRHWTKVLFVRCHWSEVSRPVDEAVLLDTIGYCCIASGVCALGSGFEIILGLALSCRCVVSKSKVVCAEVFQFALIQGCALSFSTFKSWRWFSAIVLHLWSTKFNTWASNSFYHCCMILRRLSWILGKTLVDCCLIVIGISAHRKMRFPEGNCFLSCAFLFFRCLFPVMVCRRRRCVITSTCSNLKVLRAKIVQLGLIQTCWFNGLSVEVSSRLSCKTRPLITKGEVGHS